jgi:MOSC domain-containing protein YiiM
MLRTVGAANDPSFGICAKVIRAGTVHLGDELRLMACVAGTRGGRSAAAATCD